VVTLTTERGAAWADVFYADEDANAWICLTPETRGSLWVKLVAL
jgi:hypothetical protein